MFLTQADLENEQRYWRIKRRLTNRALGEGVVWGLRLGVDLERQRLALSPGYALDCCGNDLVVECPVETTVAELWNARRSGPARRWRGGEPAGRRVGPPDSKAGERARVRGAAVHRVPGGRPPGSSGRVRRTDRCV
jgi:hypothetical protein